MAVSEKFVNKVKKHYTYAKSKAPRIEASGAPRIRPKMPIWRLDENALKTLLKLRCWPSEKPHGDAFCWKSIIRVQKVSHPELKLSGRLGHDPRCRFQGLQKCLKNLAGINIFVFGEAFWRGFVVKINKKHIRRVQFTTARDVAKRAWYRDAFWWFNFCL